MKITYTYTTTCNSFRILKQHLYYCRILHRIRPNKKQVCFQKHIQKLLLQYAQCIFSSHGRCKRPCSVSLAFLLHIAWLCPVSPGGGGIRMARGGIRLVHGLTKSTLITYFSGMKIDPKYAFLYAFFLICPSCPFQNLSI